MKYCPECGVKIERGSGKFCSSCGASLGPASGTAPAAAATAPQPKPSSRWGARRLVIIATVILGLAALGAVVVLVSSSGTTGAGSPEEAVKALAAATSHGDALAIANLLPPDQNSDSLRQALTNARSDASDAGLPLPKLKWTLDSTTVDQISPDVAAVEWSGKVSVDASADANGPLSGLVANGSHTKTWGPASSHLRFITIKQNGRWYIDPLLTLGDYVVVKAELPNPDYSRVDDVRSAGATTPTDAVTQLANAVAAKDVLGVESALSPGEARFVAVFESALNDLVNRINGQASITDLRLSDAGGGKVSFNGAQLSISRPDSSDDITLTSRCASWVSQDLYYGSTTHPGRCVLGDDALRNQLGLDTLSFDVVKEADGYHVDVLRTLADLLASVTGKLGKDNISAAVQSNAYAAAALATPTSIGEKATVTGQFSDRPLVYELHLGKGEAVRVAPSGGYDQASVSLFSRTPAGHWAYNYSEYYSAQSATDLRIVVFPSYSNHTQECQHVTDLAPGASPLLEYVNGCWRGLGSGSFTFRTIPLSQRSATLPGTLTAGDVRYELDLSGPRVFAASATDALYGLTDLADLGGATRFSTSYSSSNGSDGDYVYLARGHHELIGTSRGSVTLRNPSPGFIDGSLDQNVSVSNYTSFYLPAGKAVTITATPSDSFTDISLTISPTFGNGGYGYMCNADSAGSGGSETCRIRPSPVGRVLDAEVNAYNSGSSATADVSLGMSG